MHRRVAVLPLLLALGCGSGKPSAPEPEIKKDALINYARAKAPVLDRSIIQNDLRSIGVAFESVKAERGKYPQTIDDLKGQLLPDAAKLVKLIEDGVYTVNYGVREGGIIAYDADAKTKGGSVVRTNGQVEVMTADELTRALGR